MSLLSPAKRQRKNAASDSAAQAQQRGSEMTPREFMDKAIPFLMARLVDARSPQASTMPLRPALQKLQDELCATLDAMVTLGRSSTLLLIGGPGCGKTLVAERAISAVRGRHNTSAANPAVGVVRLSGALHADERTACLECARQLCSCFGVEFNRGATFDDNLQFLKHMLLELSRAHKSVVFVLDEVEAFARAAKQVVLYNLLDALAGAAVQATVVGVTSCYDVQEGMEKRVRSRLGDRKVVVPALAPGDAQVPDSAAALLQQLLALPSSFEPAHRTRQHNDAIARALQDAAVMAELKVCGELGATPRDVCGIAMAALGSWRLSHYPPRGWEMAPNLIAKAAAAALAADDSKVASILGLSVLELSLVMAAQRLEEAGHTTFNFEMVFHECGKAKQDGLGSLWRKGLAWRAFQELLGAGLLQWCDARAESKGVVQQQCLGAELLVSRAELDQGVRCHPHCPDQLKRWLNGGQGGMTGALAL